MTNPPTDDKQRKRSKLPEIILLIIGCIMAVVGITLYSVCIYLLSDSAPSVPYSITDSLIRTFGFWGTAIGFGGVGVILIGGHFRHERLNND